MCSVHRQVCVCSKGMCPSLCTEGGPAPSWGVEGNQAVLTLRLCRTSTHGQGVRTSVGAHACYPTAGMLRQENHEFQPSLHNLMRSCLKNNQEW